MPTSTTARAVIKHRPISSGMAMDAPAPDRSLLLPSGTMPVFVVGGVGVAASLVGEGVELLVAGGRADPGTVETEEAGAWRGGAHGADFTSRTKDCLLLPGTRTVMRNVCASSAGRGNEPT